MIDASDHGGNRLKIGRGGSGFEKVNAEPPESFTFLVSDVSKDRHSGQFQRRPTDCLLLLRISKRHWKGSVLNAV